MATSAISGTYRGFLTAPPGATQRLDLRVDVDAAIDNGAVLQRVSGDILRVERVTLPGKPPRETEIYQESWIMEQPRVQSTSGALQITGAIRFWNGFHPKTSAKIRIPLKLAGAAAEVTLQRQSSPPMTFSCPPLGKFFRAIHLEVDVCKSVNKAPILPLYATHSLKQRPPQLANRTLTVERAYGEAGVELVIRDKARSVIDDTKMLENGWTDAELHNAMERNFTQYKGQWPRWEMWGLVAAKYVDDVVGGIMFDFAAAADGSGGAGRAPERQGFAVFRRHFWFDDLVEKPQTPAQFEAARKFLWTFTHEAGHALNLVHSNEKNRENALSWMNYDWQYDSLHGPGSYWKSFRFQFDDEELLHIRHGNRSSVIMGGDPWASGGRAEAPPGAEALPMPPGAMVSVTGELPLELTLRAQPYFEFLEPVSVEVRAKNLLSIPVTITSAMHPEFGSIRLYVRRPDGRIVQYMPISCKLAEERTIELAPAGAEDGSDRYSRTVFASYGRYGFYFDEPGQYWLRAVYQGPGNLLVPSNLLRVRIGHPRSDAADRIAQDFFSYESGASLYFGGSHSEFLAKGMDTLRAVVDEHRETLAAAKIAARIARGVGLPFHDLRENETLTRVRGNHEEAMALSETALGTFRKRHSKDLNIVLERLMRTRADLLLRQGDEKRAYDEMCALAREMRRGGVKDAVVEKIERDAASIEVKKTRRATTKRRAPAKKKATTARRPKPRR